MFEIFGRGNGDGSRLRAKRYGRTGKTAHVQVYFDLHIDGAATGCSKALVRIPLDKEITFPGGKVGAICPDLFDYHFDSPEWMSPDELTRRLKQCRRTLAEVRGRERG